MAEPTVAHFAELVAEYVHRDVRVVVELGARDCEESRALASEFPAAHVYAFECNPATLPACERVASSHPRITLVPRAATDTTGAIEFFSIDQERTETTWADGNPGASSLLRASGKYPVERYVQQRISVPAVRLDAFLPGAGIDRVDALWLDIQGAELSALRGMGRYLRTVSAIHTEVGFFEIYAGQPLFWRLWAFLWLRGFSLVGFTSLAGFSGDAVFVRRSLLRGVRARVAVIEARLLAKTLPAAWRLLRRKTPSW